MPTELSDPLFRCKCFVCVTYERLPACLPGSRETLHWSCLASLTSVQKPDFYGAALTVYNCSVTGITTVLTMTFLGLEARTDLPKVPYPTALDFFVFLSFAFIFATIIQVRKLYSSRSVCFSFKYCRSYETFHSSDSFVPQLLLSKKLNI
jgi:hypothetical protein